MKRFDSLLPSTITGYVPVDALKYASQWITRNHVNINTTDNLILFCSIAHNAYCSSRLTAITSNEGVFDPMLGANVTCSGVSSLGGSAVGVLSFIVLTILAKLFCALKKYPVLSESDIEEKTGYF